MAVEVQVQDSSQKKSGKSKVVQAVHAMKDRIGNREGSPNEISR